MRVPKSPALDEPASKAIALRKSKPGRNSRQSGFNDRSGVFSGSRLYGPLNRDGPKFTVVVRSFSPEEVSHQLNQKWVATRRLGRRLNQRGFDGKSRSRKRLHVFVEQIGYSRKQTGEYEPERQPSLSHAPPR